MKNTVIYTVLAAGTFFAFVGSIAGKSAHPELEAPCLIIGAVVWIWFIAANTKR